ncbi:unnamed protein product [marine sediment metagenome]|uniref:Uncharacterized protein n=1 Tax=marine sediment metagenome TaxID=412755 RepID=X1PSH8_9ZZZZ
MNEKVLEVINKLDCVTVFLTNVGKTAMQGFRLKAVDDAIKLADREGNFLSDWQGFVDTDYYPPILHLTKLNGSKVDLEIKIPEPGTKRRMDFKIVVKFTFHKK